MWKIDLQKIAVTSRLLETTEYTQISMAADLVWILIFDEFSLNDRSEWNDSNHNDRHHEA